MYDESMYRIMLDSLYEGIYFVDRERRISFWNEGAARLTGFGPEEKVGRFCFDHLLNHVDSEGRELCLDGCPLSFTISDGLPRETAVYLRHKQGHRVPIVVRTIPFLEAGQVVGAMEIFSDNVERHDVIKSLEEFRAAALNDPLTTLPNRRYTDQFLVSKMHEYRSLGLPFGVAYLDLDNFKIINDTYGHHVGDEVLRMVSRTFLNAIRTTDVVGRWCGEEFMAVFPGVDEETLTMVSERIRMQVEMAAVRIDGLELRVTVSAGATLVLPDETVNDMIRRADRLLYQSKSEGRNRVSRG